MFFGVGRRRLEQLADKRNHEKRAEEREESDERQRRGLTHVPSCREKRSGTIILWPLVPQRHWNSS